MMGNVKAVSFGIVITSSLVMLACEAKLIEELGCEAGDGSCDQHDFVANSQAIGGNPGPGPGGAGGAGGAGGGTGGMATPPVDCYSTCDLTMNSGQTGEFPCEVDAVLDNCRRCHSATPSIPNMTVPFNWDTYAESQELVFGGISTQYGRLENVIYLAEDFMPLDDLKLTPSEKRALVNDWACICAPPRPMGETCD